MTRVYLIRHGEAEGNIYRRAQGHYDSWISAKGYRQIDALAERFKNEHIDVLYSSDLFRTRTTAGAITKYHELELHTLPELREVCLGEWEDVPWGNLSEDHPEAMTAFNDDPQAWHVEGAESFDELGERMHSAICRIAAAHAGQTVVCVSHGMAIRTLLAKIMNIPSKEISRLPHGDNTAVSLLEVDDEGIKVVFYNDVSHLQGELSTFARQSWWRKPGLHDAGNVVFRPLDPGADPELYISFYSEAWEDIHGSLAGFMPRLYINEAKRHYATDPNSLVTISMGGEAVGITELDAQRGSDEGYGWICLCCVRRAHRRELLGVQLLGHAVSFFRARGYKSIRLSVYPGNSAAIAFYRENGFEKIGQTDGAFSPLDIMEKQI